MMVLFGNQDIFQTLSDFDIYAKRYSNSQECQTRDILEITIPKCREYGKIHFPIDEARQLLLSTGKLILINFYKIPNITQTEELAKDKKAFQQQLVELEIPECYKNPELANLAVKYGVPSSFNSVMKEIKSGRIISEDGVHIKHKSSDNMPELTITYVNSETNTKYHLVKAPNSLFTLFLGAMTGNCQTYGNGELIVDNYIADCLKNPNAGFYLLVKEGKEPFVISHLENLMDYNHEIVAQSPAYLSKDNSLVFVAFQIMRDRALNIDIEELFKNIGENLEDSLCDRVMLGEDQGLRGSKKYHEIESISATNYNSTTQSHPIYCWGLVQKEIYIFKRLHLVREDFKSLSSIEDQSHITSFKQGECIKLLLQEESIGINKENYKIYTSNYITSNWDVDHLKNTIAQFLKLKENNKEIHDKLFDTSLLNLKEHAYKFGVKIDLIYNLDIEILNFILTSESFKAFLEMGIDIESFLLKIQSCKEKAFVKMEILKMICKDYCGIRDKEIKLEEYPEKKISLVLDSLNLFIAGDINPIDILNLKEDLFSYVTTSALFKGVLRSGKFCPQKMLSMEKVELQKYILIEMLNHAAESSHISLESLDIVCLVSSLDEKILDLINYNMSALQFF